MARPRPRASRSLAGRLAGWPVRLGLWAVAVGALAAGLWLGAGRAWAALVQRPEFRLEPLALALTDCPPWADGPKMAEELRKCLSGLPKDCSIFDPAIALDVRRRLAGCPWVLEVSAVQRQFPNSLVVRAAFRKPAGVVLLEGDHYLVDADGHYLPEWLFSAPAEWQVEQTPVVVDGLLRERPAIGRRWGGPRVAAGARLVEFFRGAGLLRELDLASVDVTAVGGSAAEPAIVLATAGGTRIRWGESSTYEQVPGLRAPPYLTPDNEKLAMLRSKLADYPGLRGIRYLDLRFHGQIVFSRSE